ncbi:probable Importin beta-like protein KAP120 [Zygosaccharomyces bailii ISA1307]|nr:probable Importin beta-like protein KAP120 [Zygosaccharomyces bailii ISA1307]
MSETAVLNELTLVETLEQASNPQHAGSEVQKSAEKQLEAWQTQPGFHYTLQSVYLDLSNSLQIRWLSVIQFKNGVEKYWRSTRLNAISKNEKISIRRRLFDLIDEQNNQLCIQNAQAAARIARFDFPVEWPNLFEQLEQLFGDERIMSSAIKIYNVLMHVNQIIKIFGSARIGRCKPAMQSKVPLIFPMIVSIYLRSFNTWTESLGTDEDNSSSQQVSYLALKVLRRTIADGYERPQKDESVCEFMRMTVTHFDLLISHQENFRKSDMYDKFVRCYGKLYYNIITNSPANFILLPCSTQILITYTRLLFERAPDVYNENPDTGDFWEQTAIRGFLILKRVVNFIHKRGAVVLKARSDRFSVDAAMQRISNEFLNEKLVTRLLDTLITWYLKLRPSELESWFMDPEEWMNEQLSSSYEYQIRACAENFFQDMINSFSELLVPYLLKKIENDAANLPNSLEGFLSKDAIYASFQLSAAAIGEMVDFDRLLVQVFLPEATSSSEPENEARVIRRRVCLIIDEWSTVKCSDDSKKLCYEYFMELLAKENDAVVLLTCVQALRTMIDDWNFDKKSFEPYLNGVVTLLLRKILPAVALTETRLYILNTMSDIIIQTKPLISRDLLIEILQIVPDLWQVSTNSVSEYILSNGLLRLIKNLVTSLGPHSHLTWTISLPIVAQSCNPSSPIYQLVSEDGYELWGALLQNFSPAEANFDPEFIQLIPFLEFGIDSHTEILPTLLEIVRSYSLILNLQEFFSCPTFSKIFSQLSRYFLKLRDDAFELTLNIWENLTLFNPTDYEKPLLEYFHQDGVLQAIFDSIFKEEPLSSYQCAQVIQICARVAYVNPQALIDFISAYHQHLPSFTQNQELSISERRVVSSSMSVEDVLTKFLSVWIVCFKDIFDPKMKKVHILGISSLLRTGMYPVLSEFQIIVSMWVDMLEEINEANNGDCEKYHLNDIITEHSIEYPPTSEQIRYHELCKNNDPAHNVSLKSFIRQILEFLENRMGTNYQELLNSVNSRLMESLQLFLEISFPSK